MNKIVNLDINFGLVQDEKDKISNIKMSENVLTNLVNTFYVKGIPSDQRRIYTRILDKIDNVIDKNGVEVTFNIYEYEFLKGIFDVIVEPNNSYIITKLEQAILDAKSEVDESVKPKGKKE